MPSQLSADQSLRAEIAELRARMEEAEEMLRAIRAGDMDALVVEGAAGPRLFTLQGLDADRTRFRGEMLVQVSDAVIAVDTQERITFLSAAGERQYGVRSADMLGRKLTEMFTRHWPSPGEETAAWAALREHGAWQGQYVQRTQHGRELHVDSSITALRDSHGEIIGHLSVVRDITERHHAEAALRRNTALFSQIIEQAPGGVYVVDTQFRLMQMNAESRPFFASAEPLIGRDFDEALEIVWGPEIGPQLASVFRHTLATGERYVSPRFSEHRHDIGVEQAFEWETQRITLPDGQHGVVCYFQDVTPRERAEAARRESEERLNLAVKCSQVVLFQQDLELRYIWHCNPELGLKVSDFVGKRDADLMELAEDAAMTEGLKREVIRTGIGLRQEVLVHIQGVGRHYDLLVEPQRDAAGLISGVTCAAIDITERKRAEESRRLLASIVENSRDFIGISDTHGNPVYGNRAAMELVGVKDLEQVRRSKIIDYFIPEQRQFVEEVVLPAVATDGRWSGELTMQHFVTEAKIPVWYELFRVDEPVTGQPVNFATITRDLTESKRADAALRESDERLRKAISVQNVGVLFFKLDGHILDANGALERMSGYTAEEMRRITDWAQLTPPEFMDVTRRAAAELAERGVTAPYEKQWIRKDGSRFWGLFSPTRLSGSGSESECVEFTIDITESKRAEEQLRMHRQLLETMVNHLPAAVALIRGNDLTFEMVNPGYQAISPGKQMVGKTISEVWPETMPLFGQRCRHVLETGEPFEANDERYEIHRDIDRPLETAYFSWSMRRIHLPNEVKPGLLLTIWETTARKEIELALAARTDLLNGVLEGTTDVIFVKDPNGRFLILNAACATALSSAPEQVVGKTMDELCPPDVAAVIRQHEAAVIVGGSPIQIEETIPVAGEARVFLTLKAPLRDSGGRVVGILGIGRDITERKRAEEALRESEARLGGILRRSPAGILQTDAAGCMTLVNPRWREMTGLSDAELLGRNILDIIHPSSVAPTAEAFGRLAAGGPDFQIEKAYRRKDGSMLRAQSNIAAIRSPSGEFLGLIAVILDISERLRAEDELLRLAGELSEADRSKDVFLATLAHELRNPLAPIRNGLQVMKLSKNNGQILEKTRAMMDRQVTQLVRLVDDLLDVSRITSGKVEVRLERVDLNTVIGAAVETSHPAIEQAGHELTVVVADEPIFVDADAARLAQVVSNLLNNSAKYTPQGGHVWLTVGRENGTAAVSVKDNGIGIPPAMLERVFEMFTQVDRTLEKTTGGLGIGLSLVRGLLKMHGGTIEARSDGEGMGSEFVVRLPVSKLVVAGSDRPNEPTSEVVPFALRRILVVDDNVDSADSLGQLLEILGNEVRTANDGEAGIAVAAQFRPDMVLMDIGMPKLNGYEAARRMRQHPWGRGMVLVALTGWGQEDDRKKSAAAGFDHHLVKPVDIDALTKLMSGPKCAEVLGVGASADALPSD